MFFVLCTSRVRRVRPLSRRGVNTHPLRPSLVSEAANEGGTTKPSGLVLPRAGFLYVANLSRPRPGATRDMRQTHGGRTWNEYEQPRQPAVLADECDCKAGCTSFVSWARSIFSLSVTAG